MSALPEYAEFLASKVVGIVPVGFAVVDDAINPMLFDWQRQIVAWALRLGRAALFEECGLGKTFQQIEWARLVAEHTDGKVLILAPLAVAHQTVREGAKLGVPVRYCRSQETADAASERIIVTNYDMLKAFEGGRFAGVVLDESSILKAFTGTTKRMILERFAGTPYKLCCTATPAPNDHLELGNHAQFLEVMDSNEMIARWFINDSMQAGNYRLKKHAAADFWCWVTSWAVCISKPSDLGYDDDGFLLPALNIETHRVEVDHTRAQAVGKLFLDSQMSATSMWAEKRATAGDRCRLAASLVATDPDSPWLVWCDTNNEADLLRTLLPEAVEVRGAESVAAKEAKLTAFGDGSERILITKPDIAGFGLNYQHCHNQVFVGVTYSFEKTYQALRRSWRFGQQRPVTAHLIYAESEGNIHKTLESKRKAHATMQHAMNAAMLESGLGHETDHRAARADHEQTMASGKDWTLYLGDCVDVARTLPSDSVDFTIFSPPFSTLYIYSDALADMGNCASDKEFFQHFGYLIPELHRVTKPGRLCAVHCKDLPLYMNRDGAAGLRDFPGQVVRAFEEAGWTYHSRVTIWKDPVIEMQRTKNHGLLYVNFRTRGEVSRQGMADYVVVFRRWEGIADGTSESAAPVKHAREDYPLDIWQRYASPVWFDIDQTKVLNYQLARSDKDEKHICPLQLDVIERCIQIWTNPGELVLSPFAGIGSEGKVALGLGRRFIGAELKRSYFDTAARNLKLASEYRQPALEGMGVSE